MKVVIEWLKLLKNLHGVVGLITQHAASHVELEDAFAIENVYQQTVTQSVIKNVRAKALRMRFVRCRVATVSLIKSFIF